MIITSPRCPVTLPHHQSNLLGGPAGASLYLQMPRIPHRHRQFFLFLQTSEKCVSMCTLTWWHVRKSYPTAPCLFFKDWRWTSVMLNRALFMYPARSSITLLRSWWRVCLPPLNWIILSNTARTDWGSECVWGFQNWCDLRQRVRSHVLSACVHMTF